MMSLSFTEGDDPVEMTVDVDFFGTGSTPPVFLEIELENWQDEDASAERLTGYEDIPLVTEPPATCSTSAVPVPLQNANDKLSVYRNMGSVQFMAEMEQSIRDIVHESLALFQKDPREYHPFYLRIYKYLVIGTKLGYISHDDVDETWARFDQFAKSQGEFTKGMVMRMLEKSAYAMYILTKKVVINGKVMETQKGDEKERLKIYRRLGGIVKQIKTEWMAANSNGDGSSIREDLETRLRFFKECHMITYPSECIKMNNLWKKLVTEDKPKRLTYEEDRAKTRTILKKKKMRMNSTKAKGKESESVSVLKQKPLKLEQARKWEKVRKVKAGSLKARLEQILAKKLKLPLKKPSKDFNRNVEEKKHGVKAEVVGNMISKVDAFPSNDNGKVSATNTNVAKVTKEIPFSKSNSKLEAMTTDVHDATNVKTERATVITRNEVAVIKPEPESIPNSTTKHTDTSCVCDECGQVISHFHYLSTHKSRMHNPNNRVFHCPIPLCQKGELKNTRGLWIHFARRHMNIEELCPEIGELKILNRNGTNCDQEPKIPAMAGGTCEYCGKDFQPRCNLLRHIRMAHGEGLLKENYVKCPYCDQDFKEKATMHAHVRRLHDQTEITRCDICGKGCGTSGKLWKHKVDNHDVSPEEEAAAMGIQYEPCQFCGEQLLKGRAYRFHVQNLHPESYDEWWTLEQRRRRERQLEQKRIQSRKMTRRKAQDRDWVMKMKAQKGDRFCVECKAGIKGNVQRHYETNHGIPREQEKKQPGDDDNPEPKEPWVICPKEKCEQKFVDRRTLMAHLLEVHCDFEERVVKEKLVKFAGKSGLNYRYLCTLCGAYVYDRGEVRVHIVAFHPNIYNCILNNTPFPQPEKSCPHCPSKFTEDHKLRDHVDTCHQDVCWRCPECSKVMLSPEDLSEHFLQDHSEDGSGDNEVSGNIITKQSAHTYLSGRRSKMLCSSNEEERLKMLKKRKEVYAKYQKIRSNCLICNESHALCSMTRHLKLKHDITENGVLWTCPVCSKNSFKKREWWLGHMALCHEGMVDMEQMVKIAKQINTLVDWRTLGSKTINRRGNRFKTTKIVSENPIQKAKVGKKTRKGVITKTPTKKANPESKPQTQLHDESQNLHSVPMLTTKKSQVNVEKEKRLVIRVCRLIEKEVLETE